MNVRKHFDFLRDDEEKKVSISIKCGVREQRGFVVNMWLNEV